MGEQRDRRTKRLYVKMFPIDSFEGSIRWQLDSAERGVWWDFLAFAGICAKDGWICDKDFRPFPHEFLANRFNVPIDLYQRTLDKCKEEGRIQENSKGLLIVNFKLYQSEYQRQKPYRDQKKEAEEAKLREKYETS